ncbi:MAG TPA: tRNA (guanosine(37)-N1)-methyltransferase TrmD [Gammaproteobacteria bacterium]|nr:tRNA (guanosine(37)-N1)-methyltransferase TrmD [Gammaproteobacteria bacterium]
MRIDLVSLFPEMLRDALGWGIPRIAQEKQLLQLAYWNPRDWSGDPNRRVDDRPYGGGPGMVMQVAPLRRAITEARRQGSGPVVCLSPQGRRLDQAAVRRFADLPHLVLVAGRYEGIDERLMERDIDEEWSIGDYVLSGGEAAALVLVDAVARLLPGALGDAASAEQDSFSDGLLDCPHYTRPEVVDGQAVPPVLLGGDHAAIARWRQKQALGRTWRRRPDLLERLVLDAEQRALLAEYIREQSRQEQAPACSRHTNVDQDPKKGQ